MTKLTDALDAIESMPRHCTTHHFACECRESMMKKVCECALFEHSLLKRLGSNGREKECGCILCQTARKLYPELDEK